MRRLEVRTKVPRVEAGTSRTAQQRLPDPGANTLTKIDRIDAERRFLRRPRREREGAALAITRTTMVKDAVVSSAAARELFIKHGVDPEIRCVGMYDINTLDDVEQYCRARNIDRLIQELNAAAAAEHAGPA
jgi:hypothetical protein